MARLSLLILGLLAGLSIQSPIHESSTFDDENVVTIPGVKTHLLPYNETSRIKTQTEELPTVRLPYGTFVASSYDAQRDVDYILSCFVIAYFDQFRVNRCIYFGI
jgi:hypothetical protein